MSARGPQTTTVPPRLSVGDPIGTLRLLLTSQTYFPHFATLLLLGEAVLCVLIIRYVSYTEIDWRAYMQEVEGYLDGELNYEKIKGDTGPLVYPAGFLRVYALFYRVTDGGKNIRLAQYIFAGVYVATLAVVFAIYHRSRRIPPYALVLLTLSKRLHSIYVLRLFNDCIAMLALYASMYLLTRRLWSSASVIFSLALSVKMNILLFGPAFFLILFSFLGLYNTLSQVLLILCVQVLLAAPFLSAHPAEYLARSFDLSREFLYKWTVNWRFIPEQVFLSKGFARMLLLGHAATLATFAWTRWCKRDGGPLRLLTRGIRSPGRPASLASPNAEQMVTVLFTCNLIGILFARSLHYQFYSWYAHQTTYLAWRTPFLLPIKVGLLLAIEWAWNVYPSTNASSLVLLASNALLLAGVYVGTAEGRRTAEDGKARRSGEGRDDAQVSWLKAE